MDFHFNLPRTIQALAVLIREESGADRVDFLRLLKIVYLADRRNIELYNRPITGDHIVAMDHGPVLSEVLSLINGDGDEWSRFLQTSGYNLCLVADPGDDDLSPAEIEVLREVSRQFRDMSPWDIVNWTHQLPEWQKNYKPGTSVPIPLADILESVGRPSDFKQVNDEAEYLNGIESLLRSIGR